MVGDNPLNMVATSLAATAYMLTHEAKYKNWIVEYSDAWVERARANNDIIPSNVGRDGKIGGDADGKWYGGVYGWSFSPIVPQTGKRADRNRLPRSFVGFMNAYLVTKGDDKHLDVWRRQADKIDAQAKVIDGKKSSPTMHGDQGWYSYRPGNYKFNFLESYYLSMRPSDRARCEETGWYSYLEGANPTYPVKALRGALTEIRKRMEQVDADTTSADMRLADAALEFNPGSPVCAALTQLMEAGLYIGHPGWAPTTPGQGGALQFSRLRYFDPERRRAGVPEDVAVLVEAWSTDSVTVSFVNLNQSAFKNVIVQGGAYAEHQLLSVSDGKATTQVNAASFPLRLAPGAGAKLTIRMKRFANDPTLSFPGRRRWRTWARFQPNARSALRPAMDLSDGEILALLDQICDEQGSACRRPCARIAAMQPLGAEAFAEEVMRAEGFDPENEPETKAHLIRLFLEAEQR